MKNIVPGNDLAAPDKRGTMRKTRWLKPARCSICTSSIWLRPITLKEPAGTPEPRHEWILCRSCHDALLAEMRRSPLRSPLRLRVAMGLIAADRSPNAYGVRTYLRDQRRFLGIAWVLIVAMLLHLVVIVILATLAH